MGRGRILGIPIILLAMTFTGERFELEMCLAYMDNGTVETVEFTRAPGVLVQGNTACPPFSLLAYGIG